MSFSNQIECHETCKVCSNKQKWNEDKCRCECREELSDKQRCDKGFVWNPNDSNCECDKSCDI